LLEATNDVSFAGITDKGKKEEKKPKLYMIAKRYHALTEVSQWGFSDR
jgi:hypothetical protein